MKTIPALIHATLAIGSTGAAPFYDVNITQQLCVPVCCDETPVFSPVFSIRGIEEVGTNQYLVWIHVEGAVSYNPCCCGSCQTRTQVISQDFSIPVFKTALPVVTLTVGTSGNSVAKHPCCKCSRVFVSDTPITLNIS